MDGVTGGERVQTLSRKRYTAKMPKHREPVRSLLVENPLESVRQCGGHNGGEKDVIACASDLQVAGSGLEPPSESKGAKHMLVGAPCQRLCDVLDWATGVRGDGVCNRHVCIGRLYSYKCHAASILRP